MIIMRTRNPIKNTLANSKEQDKMLHKVTIHKDMHFLLIQNWNSIKENQYFGWKLIFLESTVSPGKTEVKQGKSVECVSPVKSYFRESYKSQNINPISPTPKFTLGIIQIKVNSISTSFQCLVQ